MNFRFSSLSCYTPTVSNNASHYDLGGRLLTVYVVTVYVHVWSFPPELRLFIFSSVMVHFVPGLLKPKLRCCVSTTIKWPYDHDRDIGNLLSSMGYLELLVFSERELKFMFAICHWPSVCLSFVCLCLSVVSNVRAPYSGNWNFRQCFYAVWYLGHPWPFCKKYGYRPRGTPLSGELNTRGVAEYSDFGPIERYISETVQDRS